MTDFLFAATPHLHFGIGKRLFLPAAIKSFGKRVLLVTGGKSFKSTIYYQELIDAIHAGGFGLHITSIDHEPSPAIINEIVNQFSDLNIQCVVAIGGGSVLDAGKAISAMLPLKGSVTTYLEGVGNATHPGIKIPFVAIPTTAGTGSEATKNAVLSEVGSNGFKKSLRHNNFIPNVAIVDPQLTVSCPQTITAASGMDAFTQLLESYLSTAANPLTDAWALEGLTCVARGLLPAYHAGENLDARTDMALAAYLSGVTLANAGLGVVHGFASAIGGYHAISHGVICSALMPAANKVTVRKLVETKSNPQALAKYATVGKLFARYETKPDAYYVDYLLNTMDQYLHELKIPSLKLSGVREADYNKIIAGTESKNNPVKLLPDELLEVLAAS